MLNKHQDISVLCSSIIPKDSIIQSLIFYSLQCIIDIIVLIQYSEHLKYTIPKLGVDLIVGLLLLFFSNKVNHLQINVFITITKITSQLFILIIGNQFLLILVFLAEVNDSLLFWEYLAQRITTKISALITITIFSDILNIVILLFSLLFELYRLYQFYNERKIFKNEEFLANLQSKTRRDNQLFSMRESSWVNRMQTIPICFILLSTKDFKVNFANQVCRKYFQQLYDTQEKLESLVLDKLYFKIVKQNVFDQQIKVRPTQDYIEEETYDGLHVLRDILTMLMDGKLVESINYRTNSLELYCQHIFNESISSTYSAQIIVNEEESEIIVILTDIAQQYLFQEEMLKDEFKTQIVQSFSHELRTPLNSACNFLQCCLGDNSIREDTKCTFISPAYNALRLQSHLINDIIDFNSLYTHDIELTYREIQIKDLIDEVNSLFKSQIEMKKLALYIDLQDNQLITISTDFSRLMQIIVNFLQNSIKYSNSGAILLKLTSLQNNYIQFTIKDEGTGMNEDRLLLLHQMLSDIERNRDFMKYKAWYGFGLLISQMLILKLCPPSNKSLLIRSRGKEKGAIVTFYIENRQSLVPKPQEHELVPLRMNSRIKPSMPSAVNQLQMIGNLIQISDQTTLKMKHNSQFQKRVTLDPLENSIFTDSCLNFDDDLDQKMNDLDRIRPNLITNIFTRLKSVKLEEQSQKQQSQYRSEQQTKMSKVLSYNKIKVKEEQESDLILKSFIRKRKCTCQRILSVDDEIFNQKSIQLLMSRKGFQTNLAFNGEEAINLVKTIERCGPACQLFMFILMDYQMPIMDGVQTTRKLRSMMDDQIIPEIHIIGLTAFTSKKDIKNCLEAGMSDVLAKPLNMKEFFEILNLL